MDTITKWGLIIPLVLMIGCSAVRTTIISPQGDIWIIQSKKDALVKLEKDGVKLEIDNRGKMGIFENLMGIMLMKTEINLKNKDGD